jgi:hypothetical protein
VINTECAETQIAQKQSRNSRPDAGHYRLATRSHYDKARTGSEGERCARLFLMATEKRGIPRKSRRAKVPSASVVGRMQFTPSADQWSRIAERFGRTFSHEDRQQLVRIVEVYFLMRRLEIAAPFADDARKFIIDVHTKATDFLKSLLPPASKIEAVDFAQRLTVQRFSKWRKKGMGHWKVIFEFISEVVAATEVGKAALLSPLPGGGMIEGHAWNDLVRKLTTFCKVRSRPIAASKGVLRREKASSFVIFMHELQLAFPENLQRHNGSYGALAAAITHARRRRLCPRDAKSGRVRT